MEPGYTGGKRENPTYEQVCSGATGHYEAVRVTFDEDRVAYDQLLDVFWRQIDPTDAGGQFADRGSQYRTAIFYADEVQRRAAEDSKKRVAKLLGKEVVTQIMPAAPFWPAEGYHCESTLRRCALFHWRSWRRKATGLIKRCLINNRLFCGLGRMV